MPKIKVSLSIGYPTATHEDVIEVDKYKWEEWKSEYERRCLIEEALREWTENFINGGYELIK